MGGENHMQFPDSFFEDEVRDGFYVPALMKRSWAAQMEVLSDIAKVGHPAWSSTAWRLYSMG